VLKLLLGVLSLLLAARIWRTRPKPGHEAQMPKRMQAVDTFTAPKALGAGALLSALNPKNLALTIAAATTIAELELSNGQEAGSLAVFVLVGSLTILAPLVLYFAMGPKAVAIFEETKNWMAAHNAAIMTVILLVLGAKLIGDAIGVLSS
jgi:threonine/homoserine/homoserine lactone efflux protein